MNWWSTLTGERTERLLRVFLFILLGYLMGAIWRSRETAETTEVLAALASCVCMFSAWHLAMVTNGLRKQLELDRKKCSDRLSELESMIGERRQLVAQLETLVDEAPTRQPQ